MAATSRGEPVAAAAAAAIATTATAAATAATLATTTAAAAPVAAPANALAAAAAGRWSAMLHLGAAQMLVDLVPVEVEEVTAAYMLGRTEEHKQAQEQVCAVWTIAYRYFFACELVRARARVCLCVCHIGMGVATLGLGSAAVLTDVA